ncbi:MAG: AraC family transcriptional regulator [Anaerolineae bacterium]|nr:AraC family transcriptional regulator [Anaerolineae bacterium]
MTAQTPVSHYERINHVKSYIRAHLDEDLPRDELAKLAGYSIPHFHRMFTAHGGESITTYIRRVRMERAARLLLTDDLSVTEIALSHGYDTHSAFDKAFKQQFGYNPSEFRQLNRIWAGHLIHKHIYYNPKEKIMQPLEIKTLPDLKVLYARATEIMASPAFQTANREAFGKLMGYLAQQQAMHKMQKCVAIYPSEVEVGQMAIMDAGAVFAAGDEIPAGDGLAYQILPAGRWAVFRHVGPYDTLWQTWQAALRDWLPTSGCEFRDAPPFEDYVDDPSQTAPEVLRTDIYIPIR